MLFWIFLCLFVVLVPANGEAVEVETSKGEKFYGAVIALTDEVISVVGRSREKEGEVLGVEGEVPAEAFGVGRHDFRVSEVRTVDGLKVASFSTRYRRNFFYRVAREVEVGIIALQGKGDLMVQVGLLALYLACIVVGIPGLMVFVSRLLPGGPLSPLMGFVTVVFLTVVGYAAATLSVFLVRRGGLFEDLRFHAAFSAVALVF